MNKKFITFMFMAFLLLESRASADLNENSGGGIKSTINSLRKTSKEELAQQCQKHIDNE